MGRATKITASKVRISGRVLLGGGTPITSENVLPGVGKVLRSEGCEAWTWAAARASCSARARTSSRRRRASSTSRARRSASSSARLRAASSSARMRVSSQRAGRLLPRGAELLRLRAQNELLLPRPACAPLPLGPLFGPRLPLAVFLLPDQRVAVRPLLRRAFAPVHQLAYELLQLHALAVRLSLPPPYVQP